MFPIFSKSYEIIMLDTSRMTHGSDVASELRKGKRGGIPWSVITDGEGAQLMTSDGPKGNIGCPVQPHEVAHFVQMIQATARHLSEDEIAAVAAEAQTFAQGILDARQRR